MKSVIKTMGLALAFVLFIIIVGVAVFNNPAGLSGSDYTWRQQAVIRMLNIPMPILGAVTIVIGLVTAFLERAVPHAWKWWLAGAFLFVLTGLVTRLCNQPINAVVMTWNPNAPHCNVQHPLIGCQTRNFKKYVQKYRTMDGQYSLYGMGVWPSRRTSMDRPLGAKLLLGTVPLRR